MRLLLKYKNGILLLLLVAALLPYFIVCFCALPFADDFCNGWTASEAIPLTQKFLKQYLQWNGRYTADLTLNFHPILTGNILVYQATLFLAMLTGITMIYFFMKKVLSGSIPAAIVTFSIFLFYLCYIPNIAEGVYWFIGINNYFAGNIFFLLQLTLLLSSMQAGRKFSRIFLQSLSVLCLIASIGFNETGAALISVYYFIAFVFYPLSETPGRKIIFIHFLIAIIASGFVFLSPGNSGREIEFPERFQLFHSLFYSSLQTVRFIGTWFLSIPFVALSLVVLACAGKVQNEFIRRTDYRLILAVLVFTVFTGSFLPYFATGILGQHRTINYVFFYFIFLWLAFLVSVSIKFSLREKFIRYLNEKVIFSLLIVSVLILSFTGNGIHILKDFNAGSFKEYRAGFLQRQAGILANKEASVVPLNNIPSSFHIVDAKQDNNWWVNKCMKKFYTKTDIVLK